MVDRCRTGDSRAQHELYRLYARAMYNICLRIVNHTHEAEDILQDAFVEAFGNIGEFRADSSFGAWLKRIVVNRSVNHLRKKKLLLLDSITEKEDTRYEDPNEGGEPEWDIQQVHKAIQALPDGYRVVLTLYLLEGYDHNDIARTLNITVSTSKSQYNRAKAHVRAQLKKKDHVG